MNERPLLTGEYVVLSLLALRPMHGYEMVATLEGEGLQDVCAIEQSTLYTYLRNVESRGLVAWAEERVGGRPPRKIYELTPDGRQAVDRWLRQPVERLREVRLEFLLKLFFLRQLDGDSSNRLLAAQIGVCEGYLERVRQLPAGTWFGAIVARSRQSAAEATLGWLKNYAWELEHTAEKSPGPNT